MEFSQLQTRSSMIIEANQRRIKTLDEELARKNKQIQFLIGVLKKCEMERHEIKNDYLSCENRIKDFMKEMKYQTSGVSDQ